MIGKAFESVGRADIEALLSNKVKESRTIDYKSTLPGGKDEDKREFLADVSSFANAIGGDLIFGIKEKGGVPIEIIGLTADFDKEILRLESILRDGIEPRLPGIRIKQIEISSDRSVLLIRISQSWIAPHMVVFKNYSRFFSRNSAGKYQMDVLEIRNAFIRTVSFSEKIKRFRDERLSKIVANDTPIPLNNNPKVVIHVLSLGAFRSQFNLDIPNHKNLFSQLKPIGSGGWSHRINFDGFLTSSVYSMSPTVFSSYCQMFRSGHIESVSSNFVTEKDGKRFIPSIAYEKDIIEAVSNYLEILVKLEVPFPLVIFISLIGVSGVVMGYDRFYQLIPIDRDLLLLPEILIEEYGEFKRETVARTLKPVFDAVWNACGFESSMNYDEQGNWKPR